MEDESTLSLILYDKDFVVQKPWFWIAAPRGAVALRPMAQ
jgi:hypothetical protein